MGPPPCRLLVATTLVALGAPTLAAEPRGFAFGDRSEIFLYSESIVRVTHRPTPAAVQKTSMLVSNDVDPVPFTLSKKGSDTIVETTKLRVTLGDDGRVSFDDKASGKTLLSETNTSFTPSQDAGKPTFQVEQSWSAGADEGFYGGGEYQNGIMNFKNAPLQLIQYNTEAVVPFFVSTKGYGLLWDNYAWTFLNPPEKALVPPQPKKTNGTTEFVPQVDGDHFFYVGNGFPKPGEKPKWGGGGGLVNVTLVDASGKETTIQLWDHMANLPASLTGRAPSLRKGQKYTVHYAWDTSNTGLFVQGPDYGRTTLKSFLGGLVDYYFVGGASPDSVISGYRKLTGVAPLYAKWAYGFWQCKEHYDTQAHVIEAAKEFRNRSIPADAIVQDWQYWGSRGWGPHWDPKVYPDPAKMVKDLQQLGMHFMVSVWSKFDGNTDFYAKMDKAGWLLESTAENVSAPQLPQRYYDAWNPDAQKLFYSFSKTAHFSIGVDSLWLDATEPENFPNLNAPTYMGSGNAVMNSYSLWTTQAIADGLRQDYPEAQGARVFSLTRSSFAGQQRTGAALWSGDISGCWDSLRRQIPASLNYQLSGIPYWSEDIGGFFRPGDQYKSADYHDLLIRWFQFGAFTPIFRVHGSGTKTELWNFGEDTMRTINASAISLRYRMLPYIYSAFARADAEDYTVQRALVMDFPNDRRTWSISDEFMWGDAFLVTPIYTPVDKKTNASTRSAYLPQTAQWVNFQTGAGLPSGDAEVTFKQSEAPAFVRAGSVVVLGPLLQRSDEKPADPLEVRVYAGRDGSFTLFEDDGVSRAYQQGKATTIAFSWDEAKRQLTVGARQGSFPGMLQSRTLHVVCVRPGHGVGVAESKPDKVVHYTGVEVSVKCEPDVIVV
mmetsp:Transcript_70426/g.199700  ORF Transcript_70426/g.199700 Transcript_70426/m.199700 type:complete len:884 (-) Transcript_70426:91-2742(-)